MKIKLSKSQWERIGKTAGWTKMAGIPIPKSPAAKQIAMTLNRIQGQMMPNNANPASRLIHDLLELIDKDQQEQGVGQQQPQAQQQPSSSLSRGFQGGQANQAIPAR